MDELSTEEQLYQLWMVYTAKNDVALFKNYLKAFLEAYSDYVDVELVQLNEGFMPEGPHITRLPEGLLRVITRQLAQCNLICKQSVDLECLEFAEDLTKCLIVICRNVDNVDLISSCEYATYLVTIATSVLAELAKGNTEVVEPLSSFVHHALHFFECMYDPYFVWRKHLKGWHVDRGRLKFQPAQLHVEMVPFFYECFQQVPLDVDLQTRLFHVFGAIISGDQNNALRAICPATLDVLLKALSNQTVDGVSNTQREEVVQLKQLVLKCMVQVVHVIHSSLPDQRQVEVGALLEGFFQVLLDLDNSDSNVSLQLEMLNAIPEMLRCEDKGSLQVIFVAEGSFEMFLQFLQKMNLSGVEAQKAAMAIIRVMNSVMSGSVTAKERFREKVGYCRFTDSLKSLGQPSLELLSTLLDLVCEDTYTTTREYPIRNTQAALMLVQWLPDIQSHDLHIWLSQCLKRLCCHGTHNRMHCCNEGMISAILNVLSREKQIDTKAVGNLIDTLECLGTFSITTAELKQLVKLLRLDEEEKQNRYLPSLMHAMSVMARKDGREGALYYFDFEKQDSGILMPEIGKWPGTAFSFHTWVCLDNDAPLVRNISHLARRQLYSFTTSSGSGFEAFFTAECVLVIASSLKKEYHAIQVSECPITDQQWHSIDVVHTGPRSAFSASQLSVYIDGKLKLSAQLKFPPLNESFVHCKIGSPGISVSPCDINQGAANASSGHSAMADFKSKLGKVSGFPFKLSIPAAMKSSTSQSTSVLSLSLGSQDEHWGVALSLIGQVGSVCVFHDQLQPAQIKTLYASGPNSLSLFQAEENGLSELASKLVLHYNAKASESGTCLDLSTQYHHGRVVGNKCVTWDIKDAFNCVGGIQVIFPLLEQVGKQPSPSAETDPLIQLPASPKPEDGIDEGSDWVVVPSSSYADAKLEQNQVAGFLTLLRNLIQSSPINQETLVRENALSALGMLLQKCDPSYIDVHVLMAIQLLEEAISMVNKTLLHHVYQYLLFDFRIWSKSDFPVRIGHIQYLSTIIKDDKKYFRKKYGVQYMLDIMRTYYSNPEDSHLSLEDGKTIRGALTSLIKYYVYKEITYEELSQLMAFIVAVKEEEMIGEVLDLLISLLEAPGKRDQIYLLLYEPKMAELFYRFLSVKEYASSLKEKVLKILSLLLKTDKVYDKNKAKLRLLDSGTYPGLVGEMLGSQVSYSMARQMLEQVLATESEAGINAALYIIQLLHSADMDTKLEASRKLMSALFAKSKAPKLFAKQLAWQESITRLFIANKRTVDRSISTTSFDQVPINQLPDQQEQLRPDSGQSENDGNDAKNSVPKFGLLDLSDSGSECSLKPPSAPPSKDFTLPLNVLTSNPSLSDLQAQLGAPSPQFSKIGLFDDPSWSDLEGGGLVNSSRSSSTSVEDLNQGGRRSASSVSLSRSSPSDPSLTPAETPGAVAQTIQTPDSESMDGRCLSDSQSSTSLLTIKEETEFAAAIQKMGLNVSRDESLEKTEELCQNLLVVLFTIMWKGVDTSDVQQAWKERGQVFAAMTYAEENNDLLKPKVELERKMVEMMLQGCIMDLKETGITNSTYTENALQLIKLVYYFLCLDSQPANCKFNERIIEDVMTLLDLMTVFDTDDGWREMEQLGLSILLAFAEQDDLDLCSIASARLHTLLQTRPVEKLQESCFVMATVDSILVKSLESPNFIGDQYNFLIPVMKALVEKCKDMLNMETYLPGLPMTQMSPTFFDDFKKYCLDAEWRTFIRKQVLPSKDQYLANSFDLIKVGMKTYVGECHETMMNNTHKRNRERGESKLKFQTQILELFTSRARQENKRYQNIAAQLRNQHSSAMRQWRSTKQFFTGERGIWAERYQGNNYWKLSNQENFSRMRPKLVPNYNFDMHTDASRLRDNLGVEQKTAVLPPIALAKEVKVSDEDIGDDRLGDEEWNMISSATSETEENVGKEKLVISEECELVTVMENVKGRLEVTTTHLYFFDSSPIREEGGGEDFKLALSQLREMHLRRYNLRRSALELFLIDQTNYFLNFDEKVRNKVYGKIASLRPLNLIHAGSRSPAELLKASGLTQKWIQREISNFEYLMQLNTIAGRTYNDLSQYPVFPWILQDYTSETLDLSNPASYRDLSKPIGVVNPKNIREVQEKYEHFEDPSGTIEKFHYGTHYSNAAGVMHFLLRVEPFASLHIQLQSGRFDVADRQFHSIPGTWQCLMDNPNDVKELIPEFFYLPEFLENMNNFDLGKLQITKESVQHVILPKWASSPEDFINKHMKALESDYVSAHLHEWIDLIFGFKQKGTAAVEAFNVFYYCTYEGAVDLDTVTDPVERKALEGMINNFGQTPRQLLKEPHPRRMSFEESVSKASRLDKPQSLLLFLDCLKAFYVEPSIENDPLAFVSVPRNQPRSFIQVGMPDSMIAISEDGILAVHGWLPYDKSISNYFTFERDSSLNSSKTKRRTTGSFAPGLHINPRLFCVSHDAKLIFSGGHWDNSLRVYNISKGKNVTHIVRHTDIVTCLSLDHCGNHLISGSRDTTCMIWQITQQSGASHSLNAKPLQILCGHDAEVTCVAISIELDLAVSGSKDGTVIIHTVHKGMYVRTLRPRLDSAWMVTVEQLVISDVGQICVYCKHIVPGRSYKEEKLSLHLYSINGKHLCSEAVYSPIADMLISNRHLIFGNHKGVLVIKELFGLKTRQTLPLHIPVTCVAVTNGMSHVLVGLRDGKLIIVGTKKQSDVK